MTVAFDSLKGSAGDTSLSIAILNSKNLVLAVDEDLTKTHPFLKNDAKEGVVNVLFEENLTIRSFRPLSSIDSVNYLHQAVEIAEIYDRDKTDLLLQRRRATENIFYRYNLDSIGLRGYKYFEYSDLLDPDFAGNVFNDKIGLIGFLGDPDFPYSVESKLYSQLNHSPYKRGEPDMYLTVIIANIISMILDEAYINSYRLLDQVITFGLLLFMCFIFSRLYRTGNYELWSKLLAFVAIIIFWILSFAIFDTFRLKVDLRYFYFFLIFAPDSYEILSKNIFPRIKLTK